MRRAWPGERAAPVRHVQVHRADAVAVLRPPPRSVPGRVQVGRSARSASQAQPARARRARAGQRAGGHLEDGAQAGGELRRARVGHALAPVRDPTRVELAAERRRPARRVERALGGKGGRGVRAGAKVHNPADPKLVAISTAAIQALANAYMRVHVGARRRAREHLVAGQAAQARDVGRVGCEQGHAAAQLLPRGAQQVAQVGLVRAAVAVLVLDLSRIRVGSGRAAAAALILHLGGSGERRHSGAPAGSLGVVLHHACTGK